MQILFRRYLARADRSMLHADDARSSDKCSPKEVIYIYIYIGAWGLYIGYTYMHACMYIG